MTTERKTAYFKEFQIYEDMGLNFHHALQQCKIQGIGRLVVENGIYDLDPAGCSRKYLSISNHGFNGPKQIAVLIDGMEDFEIDFSGASLRCHGVMTPIAVTGSKNITVKNFRIQNTQMPILQMTVTAHGDGWVEAEPLEDGNTVSIYGNKLLAAYPQRVWAKHSLNIEYNGETGEIQEGTGDNTLDVPAADLVFVPADNGRIRISGIKRYPPIGNVLVFCCSRRMGCAVFCEESEDLHFENADLCSSYGMGILAQMCRNISLDHFNTVREDGHYYSIGADATHFVACEGLIRVENCHFAGQFDDALNIHGIFTRITEKGEDWLIVREMHEEATGIRIFRPGDRLAALHPKSLIPYAEAEVTGVEYINDVCIKLYCRGDMDRIRVGDDIENLTKNADILFRNNDVRDNRARGMLLATKGKVLIENNTFRNAGPSILFESDGEYWFESGSVTDVTIRGNTFDRCAYGGKWGDAVIGCLPRRAVEEGKYYHGTIRITGNTFVNASPMTAFMDNIDTLIITGNTFRADTGKEARVLCRNIRCADIQPEILTD